MAKKKHPSKSTRGRLTTRQLNVIEDLFVSELTEQDILDKHKVPRRLYNKWLTDKLFTEHLDRRIAASYRQSAAYIARCAPLAAARLVELTESQKVETARKACLDIISMKSEGQNPAGTSTNNPTSDGDEHPKLSNETAGKILAILAEENVNK